MKLVDISKGNVYFVGSIGINFYRVIFVLGVEVSVFIRLIIILGRGIFNFYLYMEKMRFRKVK